MPRLMIFFFGFMTLSIVGCAGDGLFRRGETARGQSFAPFRSTTSRIDVSPQSSAMGTNKDVLLVASVYDPDGGTLSRRDIEWTIEGPGEFVAIDSGGWFTGAGRRTGGKFARTQSHTFESKLAKKTFSSSADEPVIKHGQSYVVVSSAIEGQTVVTAVCPEIKDRDQGRVVAKILWADSEYGFPGSIVVPAGGESRLKTNLAKQGNPLGYRVRYRIIGGTAATLTTGNDGSTSLTGGNTQDLMTNADADGSAEVRIVQAFPSQGTTRVAVEVIKPDPNGVGPGQVVARNEATVEWANANLSLDLKGPVTVGENRDTSYAIVVGNSGKAASQPVTIRATLPASVTFVSADPQPSVQQGRELAWVMPAVPPASKRDIRITLKAARRGTFDLSATATTPDGAQAQQRITANAESAALKVNLDSSPIIPVNEAVPVKVRVTNSGMVPIERATVWLAGSEGLQISRKENGEAMDVAVGPIDPGQSVMAEIPVIANRGGSYAVKATITADGGLTERSEIALEARTVGLKLNVKGPDRVGIGESATYSVELSNAGDMILNDIQIKSELPRGLNATRADGGQVTTAGGYAIWKVPQLNAKETKTFTMTAIGDRPGNGSTIRTTANAIIVGRTIEKLKDLAVLVSGLPAIELDFQGPSGSVPVGGRESYRAVVRNRGTGNARDLQIAIELPTELSGVRGRSNLGGDAVVSESKVSFPLIQNLSPGQSVTMFVDVEAVRTGSARIRAVATSPDLPSAIREEQATRVTGR